MAGPQHARMTRADLESAIVRYSRESYPHDVAEEAIKHILFFNNLQTTPLDDATLETYVDVLTGKLNVTQPTVPADLVALTDAQAIALADSLELAGWDYKRRTNALQATHSFYVKAKEATGAVPTIAQYRDTFLWMANKARSRRGLADLT